MKPSNLKIALETLRNIKTLDYDERIVIVDAMLDLAQAQYDKGVDTAIKIYTDRV